MTELAQETEADRLAGAMVDSYRLLRDDPSVERLPVGSRARRARMRALLEQAGAPWGIEAAVLAGALAAAVEGQAGYKPH